MQLCIIKSESKRISPHHNIFILTAYVNKKCICSVRPSLAITPTSSNSNIMVSIKLVFLRNNRFCIYNATNLIFSCKFGPQKIQLFWKSTNEIRKEFKKKCSCMVMSWLSWLMGYSSIVCVC